MAIHDSGNLWKGDYSSEMPNIKYADKSTQYQVKLRGGQSRGGAAQKEQPIKDKALLNTVLEALNKGDPAIKDGISKLLSGESKVAYVGIFKIEAMPQADVKTETVSKKLLGSKPPNNELPPALPELPPLGTLETALKNRTNKQTEKPAAAAKPVPAPRPEVKQAQNKPKPPERK